MLFEICIAFVHAFLIVIMGLNYKSPLVFPCFSQVLSVLLCVFLLLQVAHCCIIMQDLCRIHTHFLKAQFGCFP